MSLRAEEIFKQKRNEKKKKVTKKKRNVLSSAGTHSFANDILMRFGELRVDDFQAARLTTGL